MLSDVPYPPGISREPQPTCPDRHKSPARSEALFRSRPLLSDNAPASRDGPGPRADNAGHCQATLPIDRTSSRSARVCSRSAELFTEDRSTAIARHASSRFEWGEGRVNLNLPSSRRVQLTFERMVTPNSFARSLETS